MVKGPSGQDVAAASAEVGRHIATPEAQKHEDMNQVQAFAENQSAPVLEATALTTLSADIGWARLAGLLSKLATMLPAHRRELETALASADPHLVRRIAHSVAGVCAQVGARRAGLIAAALEVQHDTGPLADGVQRLISALADLETALRETLQAGLDSST